MMVWTTMNAYNNVSRITTTTTTTTTTLSTTKRRTRTRNENNVSRRRRLSKRPVQLSVLLSSLCGNLILFLGTFHPYISISTTTAFLVDLPIPQKRKQTLFQKTILQKNNKKISIKSHQKENDDDNNDIDNDSNNDEIVVESTTTTDAQLLLTDHDQNNNDNDNNTNNHFYDPTLIRYRCRVTYDGSGFHGFQLQPRENVNKKPMRTVQGELERVLSQRFNRQVRIVAASRTDTGVHARGQAIHFDLLPNEIPTTTTTSRAKMPTTFEKGTNKKDGEKRTKKDDNDDDNDDDDVDDCNIPVFCQNLQYSMNRMLSADVRVWNLQKAPEPAFEIPNPKTKEYEKDYPSGIYAWNVMHNSQGKLYCYRLSFGHYLDPLERKYRWNIDDRYPEDIDRTMLQKILKHYEGTHDFVCFAGSIEQTERKTGRTIGTIRTVHSINLIHEDEEDENYEYNYNKGEEQNQKLYYRVEVHLEGALYKMVRNLIGTALDVCRGRLTEEEFLKLLNPTPGMNRNNNLSKPAPPQGLTLERVYYGEEEDF